MSDKTRFGLDETRIPEAWYNIIPDMPGPLAPVIHPGTLQPVAPDDLLPLFPMGLIEQEMSPQRWIDIPAELLDVLFTDTDAEIVNEHGPIPEIFANRCGGSDSSAHAWTMAALTESCPHPAHSVDIAPS